MKVLRAIGVGGLLAGALDLTYACLHSGLVRGSSPGRVFQFIASGVLGIETARAGGWQSAALGVALHFAMATLMAAAYVLAARRVPALVRQPWLSGALYGLGLYLVMNHLVVPLSNAPYNGPPAGQFLVGALFAHVVLVGATIALVARRYALAGAAR